MKILSMALILAFIAASGTPAAAEMVEVATSIAMPAPETDDDIRTAIRAAAQEVLSDLPELEPVAIVVTAAYVSAGRLHVRFLIADEAGARLLGIREGSPETRHPEAGVNGHGYGI
jgi:hypothetical protein